MSNNFQAWSLILTVRMLKIVDNCIHIIFKHNIFLKICKRVGGKDTEAGERNRKKLDDIYDDLWIKDMKISDMVAKHFKFTTDIMVSENNIAYTNIRCQALANQVRKRLGKKDRKINMKQVRF